MMLCYFLYKREVARETDQHESVENSGFTQKNVTKTILVWNGVRRKEVRVFGQGNQIFVNQSCPVNRCEIVTSRTERPIESYDAIIVVFHDELITPYELKMPEFPNGRNPNQRLIFLT
jgi:alpha-1,3-fucosyltransferase